jgi:hypothetical protein
MTLKLNASIAGVLALTLAAGAAFAQPPASGGGGGGGGRGAAFREACGADIQKFCPNVQMGPGMRACVRKNASSMSDGCKSFLQQMRGARQDHPQGGAAAPQ